MQTSTKYVLLDTETTGISKSDEVIELGIIDTDGNALYDGLFLPSVSINPKAEAVHGITLNDLIDAPLFKDEWQTIYNILKDKDILIYNAPFDVRMLNQTCLAYDLPPLIDEEKAHCIMRGYAKYNGQINPKTGQYKWIKLEDALENHGVGVIQTHRAVDDCLMTLALLRKIGKKIW